MSKQQKEKCKAMIRSAMESWKIHCRYNRASQIEARLLWEGMMAVLNFPYGVSEHTGFVMRQYVDRIMSRLLGI